MKICTIRKNLIQGKILEQPLNPTDRKESCILIELPHLPYPKQRTEAIRTTVHLRNVNSS